MTELLERLAADIGGRYIVERELGRGGMATVYLARDLKDETRVAIKVMDPELAAAVGAERFKREIDVAGSLKHPHILGILASGEAAGTSYYVMPFVSGETLRDRLAREKQLPIEDAVRIAREVADALDYAHKQGIVHRDIKPENILLEDGRAMVADFGIARAASTADAQSLTKTGVALGTPHYMSPEQIFAEKDIDGRTDQYALACMLHEMLAGQPPFVGPHAQSLMAQHALDEPPLVTRFRPSTPPNVEDAILTGLAKTRADRFPTLGDFHRALENTAYTSMMKVTRMRALPTPEQLAGMQKPAPPVPMWKKAMPIAAAVVLGAGALFGVYKGVIAPGQAGGAGLSVEEKARLKKVAVLYFKADGGAEIGSLADGLTEALIDRLRQVQALEVVSRNGVAPYRGTAVASDSIGRALGVGTIIQGRVRQDGAKLRVDFALIDAESGSERDAGKVEVEGDLISTRDSLADGVSRALQRLLGKEAALKEQRASTTSAEAWTMFQRAQRARTSGDSLIRAGTVPEGERSLASADSLALRSATIDPRWAAPHVLRGRLAHGRAFRLQREPMSAAPWLDSMVAHAERALALDPESAEAYELRGTGRFERIRYGLVSDKTQRDALLQAAEDDLTKATSIEPTLASAWNVMSMVQYSPPRLNVAGSANYARKAYEADAYLASAPAILWRLYVTNYDMQQATEARRWCEEGARRFPDNSLFVRCRLWMMTLKGIDPVPAEAWRLAGEMRRLTPPQDSAYGRRETEIAVAATLARANLADSARRVLQRARAGPDIDPRGELLGYEAFVRTLLGDKDEAIRLLEQYLTQHPEHRAGFSRANAWWWSAIDGDPRFQRVKQLGS